MRTSKSIFTKIKFLSIFVLAMLTFNLSQAQTEGKTINGIISDSYGPMEDVNIVLKGTKTGTTTNKDGKFIFPKNLQVGDVLIVSYLGYKNQIVEVKNDTNTIKLVLKEDMIEVAGALNTNTPYKSKRTE